MARKATLIRFQPLTATCVSFAELFAAELPFLVE
jgi:hypothetical protein